MGAEVVQMFEEYGTTALELKMNANTHVITVPKGTIVLGVKEVVTQNLIETRTKVPPIERVVVLFHVPARPPGTELKEEDKTIFVFHVAKVGTDPVPINEEYIGTIVFQGILYNVYFGETNDKGSTGLSNGEDQATRSN